MSWSDVIQVRAVQGGGGTGHGTCCAVSRHKDQEFRLQWLSQMLRTKEYLQRKAGFKVAYFR